MLGERAFLPTEPARRRAARANLLALLGFLGLAALVPIARAALIDGSLSLTGSRLFTAEAVLCPCTGLAAWLVWRRIDIGLARKRAALRCWGWLMLLSALWPAALKGTDSPLIGLGLLLICLVIAVRTAFVFRPLRPGAALLILPYAAWLGLMSTIAIVNF